MELSTVIEITAILTALAYVILAAVRNIWCWLFGGISSLIYVYLTYSANLIGESLISSFYVAMAIFGWWQWKFGKKEKKELRIHEWNVPSHLGAILLGFIGAAVLGRLFSDLFNSAMPYTDAFTTSFSLVATFMVTRKVLSNWLYWVIIDAFNIFLYWHRGLELSSGLYALYTVLAIVGYLSWRKEWLTTRISSAS